MVQRFPILRMFNNIFCIFFAQIRKSGDIFAKNRKNTDIFSNFCGTMIPVQMDVNDALSWASAQ